MNEHGFIKAVHRKLPPNLYRWKIHDTYTGGVPDAMYAGPAGTLFVEYKYVNLPKRTSTRIKTGLSALQLAWLDMMCDYKVVVAVIIGSKEGTIVLTKKNWHKPLYRPDFCHGLTVDQTSKWIVGHLNGKQNEKTKPNSSDSKLEKPMGEQESS